MATATKNTMKIEGEGLYVNNHLCGEFYGPDELVLETHDDLGVVAPFIAQIKAAVPTLKLIRCPQFTYKVGENSIFRLP